MFILGLLFFSLVVFIALFSIKLIKIVKENNINKTINFFKLFLYVIGTGLALIYMIMIIVTIINIDQNEFTYLIFVKLIIHAFYYISIFKLAKQLLTNLGNEIIFDDENVENIQKLGANFIYLGIIEIFAGLLFGVFRLMANSSFKEFRLETNPVIILYLIIGNILLIISYILKKAISIYKENQLTI